MYHTDFNEICLKSLREIVASPLEFLPQKEWKDLMGPLAHFEWDDIDAIYWPLVCLLSGFIDQYQLKQRAKSDLAAHAFYQSPYVIGITGSVSAGKSTCSRFFQALLQHRYSDLNIELVTLDSFLYDNTTLESLGLMDRKGFPESFDLEAIIDFLKRVKQTGEDLHVPRYSHHLYNIVSGERQMLQQPDILIVEGLNILQPTVTTTIGGCCYLLSDFIDYTVFLDAAISDLESWFVQRVKFFSKTCFKEKEAYFYELSQMSEHDLMAFSRQVWRDINLKNYNEYVLPYRNRANMILRKNKQHKIDQLWLR